MGKQAKQGPAYCSVGDTHYNLGEFESALHHHKNYFKIVEKENDRAEVGRAYGRLGKDYRSLGKFQAAIFCHTRQQSIAIEIGDKVEEERACENLGSTYYNKDDFNSATVYYKRALRIAEEIGDKAEIARANRNLSTSCCHAGAYEDAIRHHCRDLSIVRSLEDKVGEGVAYGNLGSVYFSQGLFEKAIECQELNLNIAKEVGDRVEEGKAGYELGCSFESLGRLKEALDCFRSSLKQFDQIRSRTQSNDDCIINLQNEYHNINMAICRVLLKQNKIGEALSAVEKGRAQVLKERLKSAYRSEASQSGSAEQEDNLTNLLSHLPSTTVYLAIDRTELYIWVLLKGKVLHFEKRKIDELFLEAGVTSLASLIRAAYPLSEGEIRSMATSDDEVKRARRQRAEQMEKALRILYDVVINPVRRFLKGNELIIVPDGPLCVAPFAAFMDSNSKYLCESFRIRVIPSLTCLNLIVDSSDYHSRRGALLVGNPCLEEIAFDDPSWNWKLPCAEEEVEFIGELVKSEPLTGKEATKEEVLKRLKSTPYRLVHIAAHGIEEKGEIYLTPNPMRESEEPEEEDYMLTMAEVMSVKLRTQLAVLGCCHSTQGQIKAEGAVGIARAFLAAGTRCVLVSLWEINDEATLEFMKTFYRYLVFGKVKASVALNQAIKKLRESERFGGVEYWAAFQLIGDDMTLEFEEEE